MCDLQWFIIGQVEAEPCTGSGGGVLASQQEAYQHANNLLIGHRTAISAGRQKMIRCQYSAAVGCCVHVCSGTSKSSGRCCMCKAENCVQS